MLNEGTLQGLDPCRLVLASSHAPANSQHKIKMPEQELSLIMLHR